MAGTVTLTEKQIAFQTSLQPRRVTKVTIDWVADAADGSVPDTVIKGLYGFLMRAVTNPGATAPTDNYDIVLNDSDGYDALAGALANRDTADTETVVPATPYLLCGDHTFKLSGNSVNSATGQVVLYLVESQ